MMHSGVLKLLNKLISNNNNKKYIDLIFLNNHNNEIGLIKASGRN